MSGPMVVALLALAFASSGCENPEKDDGVDAGSDAGGEPDAGKPDAGKPDAGKPDSGGGDDEPDCQSSADCDDDAGNSGQLCVDGECTPCTDDAACSADDFYGEGSTCEQGSCRPACPNDQVGCPCVDGECSGELVCDDDTQLCREPLTCNDVECAEHQLCVEGDGGSVGVDAGQSNADGGSVGVDAGGTTGGDARCIEECEPYWLWSFEDEKCRERVNCDDGAPNSIFQECQDAQRQCMDAATTAQCGDCLDGYVDQGGACREAETCASLDCAAQSRDCEEATGNNDAVCLDCLDGYQDIDDTCYFQTCEAGVLGSIRLECQYADRICEQEGDDPAYCGECRAWFTEDGEGEDAVCRPVKTCAELGCDDAHRTCVTPQPSGPTDLTYLHDDAVCGSCYPGFRDGYGECIPTGVTCNTISDSCESDLHRTCVDGACDECIAGYIEDPETGVCVLDLDCSELNCQSVNRECVDLEGAPAECTVCIFGSGTTDFIEDIVTGQCRPAVTCDDLSCKAGGLECQPHTAQQDAYCRPDCGENQIWSQWGCITCPSCDQTGEDGHWPEATRNGRCICRTQDGYFYNEAGDIGAYLCDADGDGWQRESARSAIESDDSQVRANARCDLRVVDRFVLESRTVNWFDSTTDCVGSEICAGWKEVLLEWPASLYETDRNDDQYLLELDTINAPEYGGRQPLAEELNRLTKYCVDGSDYNDNLVEDVNEWDYRKLPPGFPLHLEPFNRFSYFAELHRGWYEEPATGKKYGSYHVREKSRRSVADNGDRVPVVYYNDADLADALPGEISFYETCALKPDPDFADDGNPTIGRDFARYGPGLTGDNRYGYALAWPPGFSWLKELNDGSQEYGWDGMNLSSQFKCAQIVEDGNPELDAEVNPHKMRVSDVADNDYKMNICTMAEDALSMAPLDEAPIDDTNPFDPVVDCQVESPRVGDVGWIAKEYVPYLDGEEYEGGCVNQIVASRARCGTCGLGVWIDGASSPLGPETDIWQNGGWDIPPGCENIDLSGLGATVVESFDCDDESITSSFIFVDGDKGDDDYNGTRAEPVKTITQALVLAAQRNVSTQVVHGIVVADVNTDTTADYNEKIVTQNGVSILGGYASDRDADDNLYWVRRDDANVIVLSTVVEAEPNRVIGLEARGVTIPTIVDRLSIVVEANSDTGVSLYGVYANEANALVLRDVAIDLRSSSALDGADGQQNPTNADDGANGDITGVSKLGNCPGAPDETYATSGRGGGWSGCADLDGEAHPAGGYFGEDDCGETARTECSGACNCEWDYDCGTPIVTVGSGTAGQDGIDALPELSAVDTGGLWAPLGQTTGGRGGTGQGGGGGAGYTVFTDGSSCANEIERGGGGGAGGCGGYPGEGGEAGGSSFGVFAISSTGVTMDGVELSYGNAGNGGAGGPGGVGGNGGIGGGVANTNNRGGTGGAGGDGGDGSGGNSGLACAVFGDTFASTPAELSVTGTGSHGGFGTGGGQICCPTDSLLDPGCAPVAGSCEVDVNCSASSHCVDNNGFDAATVIDQSGLVCL
ncbi:MAG: hypothetical protein GY842_20240 [bacterium]|nr:hypothetical protein [bacterium]